MEERLAFYESGSNPTKNQAVMQKVLDELKAEEAAAGPVATADMDLDDAAPEAGSSSSKKEKKRKRKSEAAADGEDAAPDADGEGKKLKKKKSKKALNEVRSRTLAS